MCLDLAAAHIFAAMPLASALRDLGFEDSAAQAAQHTIRVDRRTARSSATRPAMGTLVTVQAVGPSESQLCDAAGRAFDEMDRLVAILSRRDTTTPLAQLNRAARIEAPPPELAAVVRRALAWHRATGGAFDVTVLPVVQLFEAHAESLTPTLPSDAEVREARALVGAAHVRAVGRGITLGRAGMALTLDGIAKGYIVDAMAAALERQGVKRYLVEAGGDIRARGLKEGRRPWRVAVQDPDGGVFPALLDLTGGAVATSGSYARRFSLDETHHHIVDPGTGVSPADSRSVTVVAPTATDADALATAVFLMGPEAGCRYVDRLPGCACLAVDRRGNAYRSRAWRDAAPDRTTEEMA